MKKSLRFLALGASLGATVLVLSAAARTSEAAQRRSFRRLQPAAQDLNLSLHSVDSGGMTRWYRVSQPPVTASGGPYPVVVMFHGGGGNALQAAGAYGVGEEAAKRGYLAVFPEGTGVFGGPPLFKLETWNAGGCCAWSAENDVDDVGFFADMLVALQSDYAIDPARVFVTGMSNGAMMTYRIAAERPDLIAGAAPVEGSNEAGAPTGPVPMLAIHGLLDDNVPFEGGYGTGVAGVPFTSQLESILPFVEQNGGTLPAAPLVFGQAQIFIAPKQVGDPDGADTLYMLALDGGHSWPGTAVPPVLQPLEPIHHDVPATPLMFDFFDFVSGG